MFQINPLMTVAKQKSASGSLAERLLSKRTRYADNYRRELPKAKSAGDVLMMDWKPLPLFYSSQY